jgi:ribosome-associated protein
LAILCLDLAGQFKASDIVLLGVSKLSSFADHFLICTGLSTRQVQGIADNLERALRNHGLRPLGIEGRTEGKWVLMDYGEIIIHIFYEPVRHFYDLESLWSEAERLNVNS